MIWLLKPDHPKTTELAPAMAEGTGILPGLPAVAGKPVSVGFDGGRLTSDAGILLLSAVEQRLRIAERRGISPVRFSKEHLFIGELPVPIQRYPQVVRWQLAPDAWSG
jgi:hypothetical protein